MLKIHNTLTRELEQFVPLKKNKASFYQCGPTVYGAQHIGNLRAMTMGDLIRRSLQYLGYEVDYVRNYTDVGHLSGDNEGDADTGEDRMEKGSKREGLSPVQIADKYIHIFEDDTAELNIIEPTHKPRATEYISEMAEMVQVLLDKGFAYIRPRAIYFDTSKFKNYTKLSGQKLDQNETGAGSGDVQDKEKINPSDFAVWFFKTGVHAKALQWWPSDFRQPENTPEDLKVEDGAGFPGWHIECSAMSKKLLGDTLDLHMGGVEHISIHHTNEIAQSEAANGKLFINYWLHNEHLTVDGGKMSKSEGTGFVLSEIKEKGFDPVVLRYFFLLAHYRSKQNFTWEALTAAQTTLERLTKQLKDMEMSVGTVDPMYKESFIKELESDFNIPAALAIVWKLLKDDNVSSANKLATILDFDQVLGLDLAKLIRSNNEVLEMPSEVEDLLAERQQAREHKDWKKSDEIRDQILRDYNLKVLDEAGGQKVVAA